MEAAVKILIVDDEKSIRFSLEETLTRDGYQVIAVESGEDALEFIASQTCDLALIDLKLPGIGGVEVLTTLRKVSPETIAIVLTAHASLETAVNALRQGAYDYLFKPCRTVELRQSIRQALLDRRQELRKRELLIQLEQHLANSLVDIRAVITDQPDQFASPGPAQGPAESLSIADESTGKRERVLQRNGLIVDFLRHVITLNHQVLELSLTEFQLLTYLMSEAPRVVPPQELVRAIHGYNSEPWEASEMVRYHIYRLRQKIKAAAGCQDIIRTVRGVGYTIS